MGLRRSKDVTERDAFGNPIEDPRPTSQPLTGGDPLRVAPAAATVPAPAPARLPAQGSPLTLGGVPTLPRPLPPRPPRRAGRRILGGLGGLVGMLLFFGPFLVGGWFVYHAVHNSIDHTTAALRDLHESPTLDPKPATAPTAPTGLGARSLLTPTAVNALLRKARTDPGGKLVLLRLAPDRADLQFARPGRGLNLLEVRWDGSRSLVRSPAGGIGSKAITFSGIDRHAPARLVRAAAHRLGRKPAAIDYLVLLNVLGGPTWSAYFHGGATFQADAHGHITRRIQ